jgi:GT2 family glycosyltransferase
MTPASSPLLVFSAHPSSSHPAVSAFKHVVIENGGAWVDQPDLSCEVLRITYEQAPHTHVLFLGAGDEPVPGMWDSLETSISLNPRDDILYGNAISKSSRALDIQTPARRPEWSPHRIRSENFVGETILVRATYLVGSLSGLPEDTEWDTWEFLRSAASQSSAVAHVDETWCLTSKQPRRIIPVHVEGHVTKQALSPSSCTLITLTAGAVDETRATDSSLVEEHLAAIAKTSAAVATHVVAIGSECSASVRDLLRTRRDMESQFELVEDSDDFNFARRTNRARASAASEILVFINDDFIPRADDWLDQLIAPFEDPTVGIVGATLLYGDETVQHVGIGLVHGNFHHFFIGEKLTHPRVAQLIQMNREVDAVTGACMAIRADLFDEVGGLFEGFPLNFNDVDLCLKVRAKGFSVVHVGEPIAFHLESKTREAALLPEEFALLLSRWPSLTHMAAFPFDTQP